MPHGPIIVVCSPPLIRHLTPANKEWGFSQSSMNVSQSLHTHYERITKQYDGNIVHFINCMTTSQIIKQICECTFFETTGNEYIQTGSDSVHIDAENNRIFAEHALFPLIINIINGLQAKSRRMSVPSFTSPFMKHHAQENKESKKVLVEDEDSISDLETERH